jgi:hypothetical protein
MLSFPLATEDFLEQLEHSDLVQVALQLQQLALIQDDQIEKMQKLIELHQETLILLNRNK